MIASSNKNKIAEITTILQRETAINWQFINCPPLPEPEEPFSTYLENASHKAKYYGDKANIVTLSEDSGLSIEALNHFPGVHTRDFVEQCGSIENAFKQLKEKMQSTKNYSATFVCAAALYMPTSQMTLSYEATEQGTISFPPRGTDGFGFDPVFIPSGYEQTIAELGMDLKNRLSHRAMAIKGLLQKLQKSNYLLSTRQS